MKGKLLFWPAIVPVGCLCLCCGSAAARTSFATNHGRELLLAPIGGGEACARLVRVAPSAVRFCAAGELGSRCDVRLDARRRIAAALLSDDISPGQEVHHDGATSYVETLGVPRFEAVKGLACLSKGMRQQLYTLLPPVDGEARPVHGPWEVVQNAYTEDVYRVLPCTSRRRRATSPSEDEAEFKKQCKMHDALRRF
eukprot:scaffold109171_cov75-Phaeocystis_antarctica.AAC.2